MALVIARDGVDLKELAEPGNPTLIHCGSAGSGIARTVLAGNGQAEVPLWKIRLVTGTKKESEAILDNFTLLDASTKRPLIWELITEATA